MADALLLSRLSYMIISQPCPASSMMLLSFRREHNRHCLKASRDSWLLIHYFTEHDVDVTGYVLGQLCVLEGPVPAFHPSSFCPNVFVAREFECAA
jgi:hypothetical protein